MEIKDVYDLIDLAIFHYTRHMNTGSTAEKMFWEEPLLVVKEHYSKNLSKDEMCMLIETKLKSEHRGDKGNVICAYSVPLISRYTKKSDGSFEIYFTYEFIKFAERQMYLQIGITESKENEE